MKKPIYKMRAKVWLYVSGSAGWHFIALPKKQSAEIKKLFGALRRGWGSLPVLVRIGATSWRTSIFPDSKKGVYILPLKAEVRKKEKIIFDDMVNFILEIRI